MKQKDKKQKSLALALGGGAALGFAHIGFLQILEENGIKVDAIAGTSMGSIVGAFHAKGYNGKELEFLATKKIQVHHFFTDVRIITWLAKGLVSGKQLEKTLNRYLEGANIEDLKIPFVATATDIMKGEAYNFAEGSVSKAIRASISVPGIFTPIYKDDMVLVDGGVLNNVPCDLAKKFNKDIVIAVDVLGDYLLADKPKGLFGILFSTFNLQQCSYSKLKGKNSDIEIKMDIQDATVTSFDKKSIKSIIEQGRKYGLKYIEEIKQLLF